MDADFGVWAAAGLQTALMATEVAFESLHAKYADDDSTDGTEATPFSIPLQQQTVNTMLNGSSTLLEPAAAAAAPHAQSNDYDTAKWAEYDDEEDDSEDEDLYAALEWADDREGLLQGCCQRHSSSTAQHQRPSYAFFSAPAAFVG